ncbi:MAG: 2OG-Fe(II) oxygenase [Acidobacteriota bacterium]
MSQGINPFPDLNHTLTQNNIFSFEECCALINLSETVGFRDATIEGEWEGPRGFLVSNGRHNYRAAAEDFKLADALFHRLRRIVPETLNGKTVVGLNERLRFYRYTTGQKFAPHTDGYFMRSQSQRSLLTLIIYLNQDFAGGETFFLNSQTLIAPETGKVLLFAHQLWHEGLPVLSGTKYILRTDVIYH